MPTMTTGTGLFDPVQSYNISLAPLTCNVMAIAGNVVTLTTTAVHGFGTVLTQFQRSAGYNVATGAGVQLGVIISGGAGSTILNSTWLVVLAPTTVTFTFLLTPAQAAQVVAAGSTLTGATVTPFMTLPPGVWDIVPGQSDILEWCSVLPPLAAGPVGGTNTTVNAVVGGSVLPFGVLGNATGVPIGGGTYTSWLAGGATAAGDSIVTDGIAYFLQFGATVSTSLIRKRYGTG